MTRGPRCFGRRAQVLVYPWVRPGAFLAIVMMGLGLALWLILRPSAGPDRAALSPHGALYPRLGSRSEPARTVSPLFDPLSRNQPLYRRGTLIAPAPGIVDVTVLANTLHLGATGPEVPIAVGFALDGAPLPRESLGRGLDVGEKRSLAVARGARVAFVSAARFDGFGAVEDEVLVRSDQPGGFSDAPGEWRAVLATSGDLVPHLDRPGFGGQPSLSTLLAQYIGPDGRLHLPPGQAIVACEYTSHFHHPAADFQDLLLLVSFTAESTSRP